MRRHNLRRHFMNSFSQPISRTSRYQHSSKRWTMMPKSPTASFDMRSFMEIMRINFCWMKSPDNWRFVSRLWSEASDRRIATATKNPIWMFLFWLQEPLIWAFQLDSQPQLSEFTRPRAERERFHSWFPAIHQIAKSSKKCWAAWLVDASSFKTSNHTLAISTRWSTRVVDVMRKAWWLQLWFMIAILSLTSLKFKRD